MGQPDGLVEWYRRQFDEDERLARAASPGPWHVNAEQDEVLAVDGVTVAEGFALSGRQLRATTSHVARHDPARVLAQVAAHRAILDEYETARASTYTGSEASEADILESAVRHLATVYADRDGWREEWRPQ